MGARALNLLEEEVWRKGLGKTERGVQSLTCPPASADLSLSGRFTHSESACQGLAEKAVTDVMTLSANAFPLSFSGSGSRPHTPTLSLESRGRMRRRGDEAPSGSSQLTVRCKVEASRHLLRPEVFGVVSALANLHLQPCDQNFGHLWQ